MFKLTKLITLRPEASAADRQRLADTLQSATRSNPHVLRARLQPTLPGVWNGGDLIWHVQFADEGAYRACIWQVSWREVDRTLAAEPVSHVDSAAYQQGSLGVTEPGIKNGIHRTLLLAIRPAINTEKIGQFEAEMREMARYVPAIRNWGFSRVLEGSGARQWSYVWEQEFRDLGGLHGSYMMHPIHFARIDRWFDTETTDWIVETHLCHTFCTFEDSMLTPLR
jgi:hypothetical protein